jgi:hypothetical protein
VDAPAEGPEIGDVRVQPGEVDIRHQMEAPWVERPEPAGAEVRMVIAEGDGDDLARQPRPHRRQRRLESRLAAGIHVGDPAHPGLAAGAQAVGQHRRVAVADQGQHPAAAGAVHTAEFLAVEQGADHRPRPLAAQRGGLGGQAVGIGAALQQALVERLDDVLGGEEGLHARWSLAAPGISRRPDPRRG